MKKLVVSLVFVCVCALACLAADLAGSWKGAIKLQNGDSLDITYKLNVEGETLSGVVVSSYGELPLIDGKVKGNDFTFKLQIGEYLTEHSGKFYGDSIVVKSKFQNTERQNTFKRVTENK